jgi:subtilisin-like proprotein convertase family protein
MKRIALIILLLIPIISFSQNSVKIGDYYSVTSNPGLKQNQSPIIRAKKALYLSIDINVLQESLVKSPQRGTSNPETKVFMMIPNPNGGESRFEVYSNTTMHLDLQQKYEGIRTYDVVMEGDPGVWGKIDFTTYGFHAMIMTPENGTWFIDPVFLKNDVDHMAYFKKDFLTDKNMECEFTGDPAYSDIPVSNSKQSFGNCELKTYRLALSATGEYTIFHGGSVADAAAAQVTTMNRVNGIYERDMAVTMTIVANNDDLIFTNPATDPFSNGNASAMLGENQETCDDLIGSANYDIGHVFGTNSGGVAYLGVVCNNSFKGRGVTGSSAPIGDPFDIDYVAHEMGHQFACNHSFNNSCNGNRNNSTAMEPGSGSTIMAYAGICPPNVQSNSDDHFHGINLEEMGNFTLGSGGSCATITPLSNNAPVISGTNGNVTIPANTPFALTAFATDQDDDVLTYNWEQMDNQISTQPPSASSTGGPNFRSNSSILSPTRYFPDLQNLASGSVSQWEVISSVTRVFNFRVMVRDNSAGAGCNDHADVEINVDAGSGPFVVNQPTANGISWIATSTQTVEWDVANTDQAPVSASLVSIFLSTDGGNTYPVQLAENIPNDGTENIILPNTPSTTCRMMVMSQNGSFFDISNNNFEIAPLSADFSITTEQSTVSVCPPNNAVFTIDITATGGFNDPVTLEADGVPPGMTAVFDNEVVIPDATDNLTVSGTENVIPGAYNITVGGTSTTGTKLLIITVDVVDASINTVDLSTPANVATDVIMPVNFNWSNAGNNPLYDLEVATDIDFNNIVSSQTGLTENMYSDPSLENETTYYWRVTAYNLCSTAPVSEIFSFTTGACNSESSTDVPKTIPSSGTPTITSTLSIVESGAIADLNVLNLSGQHTWVSDVTIKLTSPQGTTITLFSGICDDNDDWDLNFDDDAAPGTIPCPPTDGGFYQPNNPLSSFNGENVQGTWILSVSDVVNQDGGVLNSWGLDFCTTECIEADVPLISASDTIICGGDNVTLSIVSGNLNGASEWEWYANSCGETPLGFGNSIAINILDGNQIFARGVGGCSAGLGECGSIMLDVTYLSNSVGAVLDDNTLFSLQEENATYQWVDCNNGNEPIEGATDQFFGFNTNGSYAVIVTSTINPSCNVISDCIDVIFTGIEEIENNTFTVFPNPSTGKYRVIFNNVNDFNQLEISDYLGKIVYSTDLNGENQLEFDISDKSDGIYYVKLSNNSGVRVVKLIKQ